MKARITHLKAPWPSGALVGAVVLFASGVVPAWAAGKCVPAEDGDEAEFTVPVAAELTEPVRLPEADQVQDLQAKLQALTCENEMLGTALAEVRSKVSDLELSLAEVTAERDAARSGFVHGTGVADAGGSALPPAAFDRGAAEVEAKALGVSFNARTSDEVLAERIAAAKAS